MPTPRFGLHMAALKIAHCYGLNATAITLTDTANSKFGYPHRITERFVYCFFLIHVYMYFAKYTRNKYALKST